MEPRILSTSFGEMARLDGYVLLVRELRRNVVLATTELAYGFLGQVCVKTDMVLGNIHVPLE